MGLPWYLKPDWLLHAELLDEQERISATTSARAQSQDKEIEKLQKRISELEMQLFALERYLSEKGILPPMPEEPEEPSPDGKSHGEPVTFPSRTEMLISCPCCGRRQKGNRNACYSCGTPFLYADE